MWAKARSGASAEPPQMIFRDGGGLPTRRYAALIELLQPALHQRPIADVDLEQFPAERELRAGDAAGRLQFQLFEEIFPPERIAVRVCRPPIPMPMTTSPRRMVF